MQHPKNIRISDYDYDLPEDRIAAFPLEARDRSRLLVFRDGAISESEFSGIAGQLPRNTLLVFNNTRVIQARLLFTNDKAQRIEIFCLEPCEGEDPGAAMRSTGSVRYKCLVGNLRRWKQPELVLSTSGVTLSARLIEKRQGYFLIGFEWTPSELAFMEVLQKVGNIPIPPYLNREPTANDQSSYQTVYAKAEGSVAAPTAGLHFTPAVFSQLNENGVDRLELTLHVGAGTFMPVKSETLEGHEMHAEFIEVDADTIRELSVTGSRPVIAVGTTSLRALESLYWIGLKVASDPEIVPGEVGLSQWEPYAMQPVLSRPESFARLLAWMQRNKLNKLVCKTQILIAPPYRLMVCEGIVTNFHQPRSTLLLLIAAIVGEDWKKIYTYALSQGFRFLSYGDSSLLLK